MKKNSNDFDVIDFSQISPQKFEDLALDYTNIIFTEKGTEILPTRYTKDGGKDIIITHISKITNFRAWVECKNHKRNLGLSEIGKNIVLVISKRINKLIYISASSITETAQAEILNVGEKNNFEVLFLDGDNYKRELTKYPDLLNNYFTLRNPLLLVQESDVKISSFISEFEKGVDIVPDSASFFYLERGNSFYLNFIIKNHTEYNMENVCIKAIDVYDDLFIVEPTKDILTISMMSDYGIHFFCVYRGVNKEQKIPDYEITYLLNGETKHEIIHNLSISLKNIVRIPLTGKKVNEFIGIKWSEIIDLIKRCYCQILMIHGKSGTGKTRLIEETISISKQNNFSTKYFDCKNKNGATILKNILSFILEVPFDNNSLQYSKEDIKQIIENEYGKQEYTDYLYGLFTNNKLNEDAIFYITRLLTYFIENPRFENPHILFIDNIQECDEYIINMFIELIDKMQFFSSAFAIVFSANTEVVLSSLIGINGFIDYIISVENNIPSYCHSFEVENFDSTDAYLFLNNLLGNIDDDDPLIEQFIQKSGTRPFEMLMLYEHLAENKILVKGKQINIPSIDKYKEFLECVPPKINTLLSDRVRILEKNLSKNIWEECIKIIKCIVFFYNKLPSIFVDVILQTMTAKTILLDGLIIKYDKYSNCLEFYHDTLYRYFLKNPKYNDIDGLGLVILKWIEENPEYELENREKIIFYCYLKTGQISKATEMGLNLMHSYFEAFDFKSAYEISSKLYALNSVKHNSLAYFRLCYIYAMSSWETVDAYKTLEIYDEIHELLDDIIEEIPITELCMYYRDYINANSHAGLFMNNKEILDEFQNIPNIPIEFQFVIHNRYTVFYMRTNNFYLAKEHGDNAYKIATELNDNFLISTACSDIAFNDLYNKKDYQNAKMYFEKAIDYYSNCEDRTYFRILEIHNQKALVCLFEKEYKKAIKELNKSINKSKQKNNMYMEAKALNYKGIVQTHSQNYKEALATWKTAIRLNEKLGNVSSLICIYLNISSLFLLQKEYANAYDATSKAISYLNDNSNPVKWSTNFNPLIHNYLLCCMQLNLMQEAQKLLLQFPQYKDFYDNINRVHNVNEFFINESMNYFGINGYSFL